MTEMPTPIRNDQAAIPNCDRDKLICPYALYADKLRERVDAAIAVAIRYGGIDGAHHKTWVIDQMVRFLTWDRYEQVVADAKDGEDGPETYEWDCGIPP